MPKNSNRQRMNALQGQETFQSKKIATDIVISDKATKRVIAPFVRIIRKGQKLHEVEETKQFSYFLQRKPSVLIRDLSSFLSDSVDLASLIHETADVLKIVTKAAGVTVYMMDPATNEIYQSKKTEVHDRYKIRWKIQEDTTVAAYVAYKKDYVLVDDVIEDERFPEGIGYQSDSVKSVLCIPVVTPDGECFAVIELYKLLFAEPFNKDDLKIGLIVTGWMGAAIHQNSKRLALQRQQELNDYLLDLTKCYFGESVVMEKMISEIAKFAKVTLNAERCTIFVIDPESGEDLLADLFDDGGDESKEKLTAYKKPQKIRFIKERGIAGLVARTGVTVNVRDAYKDARFNKEVDQKTGFITRSILCMPITSANGVLGVIQVVNKKSGGSFNFTDETLFKTFSDYCSLALRYAKVQKQLNSMNRLHNIFSNTLKLQLKPCIHDIMDSVNRKTITIPAGFDQFPWYIEDNELENMPQLCLYMFLQVINKNELDIEATIQFILSSRKFYRRNPYHNFEHAFNVCHCMHLLLKKNKALFTSLEIKALIVAAICHDLDHPGLTNAFLELTQDDLSFLYNSSLLENHHFYVGMLLLDNTKIFPNLTKEEYAIMREEMYNAIIGTDLQVYFKNKALLENLLNQNKFNWEDKSHRNLIKAIMMTSCDISGVCKPFLVAKRLTDKLYVEFYKQGDLEKKMGLCPLSIMDRNKIHVVPEDQVNFMTIVVLPSLNILKKLLKNTEPLFTEASLIKQIWQEIIDVRGKKCWRQDDSIVEKKSIY